MTIQEAVKSGKPFKRKKCDRWYDEIIDFDLNSGDWSIFIKELFLS